MSQVTHPPVTMPTKVRTVWIALPALIAAIAVAVALALSGGDGTQTATSTATQTTSGPDEARVAAAIGGTAQSTSGPDESRTAAAISAASEGSSAGSSEDSYAEELRSDPHGTAIELRTQ